MVEAMNRQGRPQAQLDEYNTGGRRQACCLTTVQPQLPYS